MRPTYGRRVKLLPRCEQLRAPTVKNAARFGYTQRALMDNQSLALNMTSYLGIRF